MSDDGKCRVITIANARGGCGKTFLSVHLSYMLSERGKKVLLIDRSARHYRPMAWPRSRRDII